MRGCALALVYVLLTGVAATPAAAEPIRFFFSGVASGSAGDVSFTNTSFTIIATADTRDIQRLRSAGGNMLDSVAAPAGIQIDGVGGGALRVPTRVFSTDGVVPGGTDVGPAVGLSRLPHFDGFDLLDVLDPSLDGYHLRTAIGPVFEDKPLVGDLQAVPSTLGPLTMRDVHAVSFRAVPEPGGLVLLPLAALALRRRA